MSDQQVPSWPPSAGLNTPHVPSKASILTIHAATPVSAPASTVWKTLNDTPSWPHWNTWIPICEIDSQPPGATTSPEAKHTFHLNTAFTFQVRMKPSKPDAYTPTTLRVSSIMTPDRSDPGDYVTRETVDADSTYDARASYRISWRERGDEMMSRGLQAERFHEIIPTGEESCEVRTWECQSGVLAHAVKWMYGKFLEGRLQLWVMDLKKEAERRWGEEDGMGEDGGKV
ncbi:hypothetical protein MBLNU230_g5487t1 [Neophaeotheca triangularis]